MNPPADCNRRKNLSVPLGMAFHVVLAILIFAAFLVVRLDRDGQPEFPMLPQSVFQSDTGRYFTWMMKDVAADQWLYYAESQYLLTGEIDPNFDHYKKTSMDGEGVKPPEPGRLRLPYRDLSFEYPPLAAAFIVFPDLFASDLYEYKLLYSLMAAFFFLGAVWGALKILDDLPKARFPESRKGVFLAASAVFTLCFGPLLVSRLDVFAVFFIVWALRSMQTKRSAWAGLWLALGVAVKLYPIVFLPFFLLEAYRTRSWKGGLAFLGGFAAVLAAVYVPVLAVAPEGYLKSLHYHSNRGVEVESVWASWAQIRRLFLDYPAGTYVQYGSVNVAWGANSGSVNHGSPSPCPLWLWSGCRS